MSMPHRKKPCVNCPFKKNTLKGWLGKERIKSILSQSSFVCHKNNDLQCAGHMILKGNENEYVRTATIFGIDLGLTGQELIFPNEGECIKHHSNG